ncbi:Gamma-glutamyltranspeptidase 3 [Capsicum annuum]|uniref:Glutathione hydrolase n=1 Tax=Capsicum annuum TaxID=4072 RepID=A0A2G2YUZ0_CAPAN|nr:glutathione hydrolase 3 isoform X1 [Capsicum annuum]PHT73524.1 Gamma-glutamyltranspeptidase 3 [Capsicum annuum]
MGNLIMEAPLLDTFPSHGFNRKKWSFFLCFLFAFIAITFVGLTHHGDIGVWLIGDVNSRHNGRLQHNAGIVESEQAVIAADDGRCSEIGISMLKIGGHAVDAAVATALCLGVVNPMASGIGGGGFMVVRSSSTSEVQAIDMRETAPLAASQNMYNNGKSKLDGALAMGVPGELAGLHAAWAKNGRLPWKTLVQPAIKLARDGFVIAPYLANYIVKKAKLILKDPGLRQIFAPEGKLLRAGDICHNLELSHSLELISEQGPEAFYNGEVGEKLVEDVKRAGGILTMDDLRNYKVEIPEAVTFNAMGYTIVGMPPPSSGTLAISMILKILEGYESSNASKGSLGLHRMIEAMKHMLAIRMNLGDPDFVNISSTVTDMLSTSFAKEIRRKIFDNTTFPPEYYLPRWSQLRDHGTAHFCIVDADRNAVSMTSTVNYPFGGGVLSPSTGILLNNEMGDFSTPDDISTDKLPPAPSNFIQPKKRPLSSMAPIIVLKDNQLAGVIGGSGGLKIIFAVLQVFINHFVLGMDPLAAVQSPRIYHELIPNVVLYENWTCIDGDHIELSYDKKHFLEERGHQLKAKDGGAICQLIVQDLQNPPLRLGRRSGKEYKDGVFRGMLVAVSDPRKDGRPAAI